MLNCCKNLSIKKSRFSFRAYFNVWFNLRGFWNLFIISIFVLIALRFSFHSQGNSWPWRVVEHPVVHPDVFLRGSVGSLAILPWCSTIYSDREGQHWTVQKGCITFNQINAIVCNWWTSVRHCNNLFVLNPGYVFPSAALQCLWGPGDYKLEIEEMAEEQAVIGEGHNKSLLDLLRDKHLRWQVFSLLVINASIQFSGASAVNQSSIINHCQLIILCFYIEMCSDSKVT